MFRYLKKFSKRNEYKHSKLSKFQWRIHYCNISCLPVSHKVHHTKSVTLLNLLTDSWCEVNINEISWYENQPQGPKKSSFLTFKSFQSWEFSEKDYRNQHYCKDSSNNIIYEIHSTWPSLCLFLVESQFVKWFIHWNDVLLILFKREIWEISENWILCIFISLQHLIWIFIFIIT